MNLRRVFASNLFRWGFVIAIGLGILNVLTRPDPRALYPTVNLDQVLRQHRAEIVAQEGEPEPRPTAAMSTIAPIDTSVAEIEAKTSTPTPYQTLTPEARTPSTDDFPAVTGFAAYTPGMHISTAIELRETLHTVIHRQSDTYTVLFTGGAAERALALQYLNSMVNVSISQPPLELVSNWYEAFTYFNEATPNGVSITATIRYGAHDEKTVYVDREENVIIEQIIHPGMSEFERVRAIHDWLVLNLEYDTELKRFFPYESLRDRKTVCNGYALLTYELLEKADVRAYVVTGTVHESRAPGVPLEPRGHAWNLVRVDGRWYNLDTTWDDPVPDQKNTVRNDYFLVDDATILLSRNYNLQAESALRPKAEINYEN